MRDSDYIVSATPHIRDNSTIERVMLDVIIALTPAAVAAAYFFGYRAIVMVLISLTSCYLFEQVYMIAAKKADTTRDLSALVTGLLLAFNLPVSAPLWLPVIGSAFAMIIVKQLFGGLGQNFMNPALAARAFLQTAYPDRMVTFIEPVRGFFYSGADAVTSATPLTLLTQGTFSPTQADYVNAFFGNMGGSLGETSAIALILGGIYLVIRKVISWRIPVTFIGTFFALFFIFGRDGALTGYPFYEVLAGGLLLGAIYMATDYSSSPITPPGQIVMGVGCGVLTYVIRVFGGYPEGVAYAILIMNLCVPLIDRFIRPRPYGLERGGGKHARND